jgi:hypothetical protein
MGHLKFGPRPSNLGSIRVSLKAPLIVRPLFAAGGTNRPICAGPRPVFMGAGLTINVVQKALQGRENRITRRGRAERVYSFPRARTSPFQEG